MIATPDTILRDSAAAEAPVLMQVAGLAKRYGDQRALTDIAFAVRSGEVLGLIGPNGAGKTTLLEAIAGLLPVDGGDVLWRGASLPLPTAPRGHVLPAGRASPMGRSVRCESDRALRNGLRQA